MKFNAEYLGTPSGILKIFEIVFVVISFSIFRGVPSSFGFNDDNANYFGCGVLVSCMIITPLLLICYLMGRTEIQETILELALNFIFTIFLLSVSIKGISYWAGIDIYPDNQKEAGLAMASFGLFASVAYGMDVFFSGKVLRDAYYGN